MELLECQGCIKKVKRQRVRRAASRFVEQKMADACVAK